MLKEHLETLKPTSLEHISTRRAFAASGSETDNSQASVLLALRQHMPRVSKVEKEEAEGRLKEYEGHYTSKRIVLLRKHLANNNFNDVDPRKGQTEPEQMQSHPRNVDVRTVYVIDRGFDQQLLGRHRIEWHTNVALMKQPKTFI